MLHRATRLNVVALLAVVGLVVIACAVPISASASLTTSSCGHVGPPGDDWQLLWHDEFDGDAIDTTKWQTTMDFPGRQGGRYHNTAYGSYVLDENTVVKNGQLHLVANRGPVVGDDPVGVYAYSQGFVSSHDLFHHAYGYWEICARFPSGKGLWPAFWLIPQDRSWPPEFDVAEWFGGYVGPNQAVGGMHQGLASGPDWRAVHWDGVWHFGQLPTDGWHTWGLEWAPGVAIFYLDGEPTHTITSRRVPDKPMYIVLNSGTCTHEHATRGCPPDDNTVFPNVFAIDYVRVYKKAR